MNSLKQDINNLKKKSRSKSDKFTVETFDLGQDILPDRDIIYAEREF
ncbi:MAG: hypothetical protein HQM10_11720 [Candidatus Riflebacteria bacterium]|nr:hypothetical protein [Candidatus Riflebacteria bacterium]